MVQIPTFENVIPVPQAAPMPRADPQAFAQAGNALAQGGAQLANTMEQFQAQYAHARRGDEAAKIANAGSRQFDDLQSSLTKVPDQKAAMATWDEQVPQIISKQTASTSDPLVASQVNQRLNEEAMVRAKGLWRSTLDAEISDKVGNLKARTNDYSKDIAAATTPELEALKIDQLVGDVKGQVAGGWLKGFEGPPLISQALHAAIIQRGVTDPTGAKALMTKYQSYLSPMDQARSAEFLEPRIAKMGGQSIADQEWSLSGLGQGAGIDTLSGSILQQESGGGANASTSVTGARGAWQVQPDTFKQFAQPGENIDNPHDNEAVARRYINSLWSQAGGDPARVAVGYFSGPDNMAPAGSATPWKADRKDPTGKSTSSYVSDVMARLPASATSEPVIFPDEGRLYQRVIDRTKDNPELQRQALSAISSKVQVYKIQTASEREDVRKQAGDAVAALEAGKDDIDIPVDRIRAVMPNAEAQDLIGRLQVAKVSGQVLKDVQWGAPDELAAARADLASGLGLRSTLIHTAMRGSNPEATAAASGGDAANSETPDMFRMRTAVLRQFDNMVANRSEALAKDPAGYVAANPVVQDRLKAIDPENPSTFEDYARASLATQAQLGVAPTDRHVLTQGQASSLVKQLTSADPAVVDVGQRLDGLAKQFGSMWPQAWGDLVTQGKLPREYHILGMMDAPGQVQARTDFTRALQASAKRDGATQMEADASANDMALIKQNLDGKISAFRITAAIPNISGNIDLISDIRSSIRQLATFYVIQGMNGTSALQKAADGIINEKYDFGTASGIGEGARVPKGMLPQVEQQAASVVDQLKPEDLMPFKSTGDSATDQQRAQDAVKLVRSGIKWAPAEDDQGLFGYVKMNDGRNVPIKLANGNRLELRFANLSHAAAPSAAPDVQISGGP